MDRLCQEDDIEFERFQAMSIFEIKEILDAYSEGKKKIICISS